MKNLNEFMGIHKKTPEALLILPFAENRYVNNVTFWVNYIRIVLTITRPL